MTYGNRLWKRERAGSGPADTMYADGGALIVRLEKYPSGWVAAVWTDPDGTGRMFQGYWLGLGVRTRFEGDRAPRARRMSDLRDYVACASNEELRTNVVGDL